MDNRLFTDTAVELYQGLDTPSEEKEDRAFVVALARGLCVLACFSSGDITLGNAEISRGCKLSNGRAAPDSRQSYWKRCAGCRIRWLGGAKHKRGTEQELLSGQPGSREIHCTLMEEARH